MVYLELLGKLLTNGAFGSDVVRRAHTNTATDALQHDSSGGRKVRRELKP